MAWIMSLRARRRFRFPISWGIGPGRAVSAHLCTDGTSFRKKCHPGNWKNTTLLDCSIMVCSGKKKKNQKTSWKATGNVLKSWGRGCIWAPATIHLSVLLLCMEVSWRQQETYSSCPAGNGGWFDPNTQDSFSGDKVQRDGTASTACIHTIPPRNSS